MQDIAFVLVLEIQCISVHLGRFMGVTVVGVYVDVRTVFGDICHNSHLKMAYDMSRHMLNIWEYVR